MRAETLQKSGSEATREHYAKAGRHVSEPAGDARYMRELEIAKRAFHAAWDALDIQRVCSAIRSAVSAECMLRDQREFEIPLSGKLYDEPEGNERPIDPVTGQPGSMKIRVAPQRRGTRHGHYEVRIEARRRLYTLILKRPNPSRVYELIDAIEQDDGLAADGEWLCARDGFTQQLPQWLGVDWSKKAAKGKADTGVPADTRT